MIKNLSLKLLDTKTPEEVLRIFENDFIRQAQSKTILGEELVMILKFLQHTLDNTLEREQAMQFIKYDARVETLIDWLMSRYEPLEVEYQVATVFSLGMMISAYEFEFKNEEYYSTVINALDNINMTAEKVGEIPSLIFMLPSFLTDENA